MKTYLAIGHWTDSENMTSIASKANTQKDFRKDLTGNGFVAYAVISEKKLETLKSAEDFTLYDEVKKLTSNYRIRNDICDYIEQCLDIMEEKMRAAE